MNNKDNNLKDTNVDFNVGNFIINATNFIDIIEYINNNYDGTKEDYDEMLVNIIFDVFNCKKRSLERIKRDDDMLSIYDQNIKEMQDEDFKSLESSNEDSINNMLKAIKE